MATQIVMDHTGDTRHNFDPTDMQAIAEAEDRFKELSRVGFTAAVRFTLATCNLPLRTTNDFCTSAICSWTIDQLTVTCRNKRGDTQIEPD